MAQFYKITTILLLLSVFIVIVFRCSQMVNIRRTRPAYIEYFVRSSTSLPDTIRIKKQTTDNKQLSADRTHTPPENNDDDTSTNEKNVENLLNNLFSTNHSPGLHLFTTTGPLDNETDINSYYDEMVGDTYIIDTNSSKVNSDNEFKINFPSGFHSEKTTGPLDNEPDINSYYDEMVGDEPYIIDTIGKLGTSSPSVVSAHSKNNEQYEDKNHKLSINDCLVEEEVKYNKTFCTRLRNYPEKKHLEELIKHKFPDLKSFFGEEVLEPVAINERMSNAPNEEYLCPSRTRLVFPESCQNKNYDWVYVVNSMELKQGILVEECINPSSPCGENTGLTLPNRFTATCEQQYILRTLIGYNKDIAFKDTFRIPSCCKCVLKSE